MLAAGAARRWRGPRWGARARRSLSAAAVAVAALASGAVTACSAATSAPAVQIASAYVPVPQSPGTTVAYVVIRNNGGADRLLSARTSVGGRVVFRAPLHPGASAMRTVPTLTIPAHGTFAMTPGGYHMLITGAGPMPGGKDIVLTLTFARAGPVKVATPVTNPETGGSSYFLN